MIQYLGKNAVTKPLNPERDITREPDLILLFFSPSPASHRGPGRRQMRDLLLRHPGSTRPRRLWRQTGHCVAESLAELFGIWTRQLRPEHARWGSTTKNLMRLCMAAPPRERREAREGRYQASRFLPRDSKHAVVEVDDKDLVMVEDVEHGWKDPHHGRAWVLQAEVNTQLQA